MNIEDARCYALSLSGATEKLFAANWISYCVGGKWFMLMQLDAPEARVAVKLPPDDGLELRGQYEGIAGAYHMNKIHWNDLYLQKLPSELVEQLIRRSYELVVSSLPKKSRPC